MCRKRITLMLLAVAVPVLAAGALMALGPNAAPPGKDDMAGMDMGSGKTTAPATSPVSTSPAEYAPVTVAAEVRQRIGVMLGTVEKTPLTMTIRTVGILRPDETKVAHIHLKTEGWVEKLNVAFTGEKIQAGSPLLSIYSPAFFTAQREYITALQAAKADTSPDQGIVVEATRRRLELWDVPKDEIASLEKEAKPGKSLVLRSPISGTVLEKKAFAGQYVTPQDELYMVADLSTVWVQAKVFEYELPHIEIGMPATVTVSALPGRQLEGKVVFIDPTVDEVSRTTQVRIELSNTQGKLKPGMFAAVQISHGMGEGLTVPDSAVIRTGERNIVFVAASDDRFLPVEVEISPLRFADRFQILKGLKDGDRVVTSANFLIDSESRLRAGGGSMAGMAGMDMGDKSAAPKASAPAGKQEMPGMPGMKAEPAPKAPPDQSKTKP